MIRRSMEVVAEIVFFVFIGSLLVSAATIYQLYHESPPTLDLGVRIETPVVKRGGDFVVRNEFDRPVDCASWWHRYIFDDHQAQVQGFSEYRPADATRSYLRAIRIPSMVSPGTYTYEATILWHCNWVQVLAPKEVHLPTITFQVTANESEEQGKRGPAGPPGPQGQKGDRGETNVIRVPQ
jgi:hypothetical protein